MLPPLTDGGSDGVKVVAKCIIQCIASRYGLGDELDQRGIAVPPITFTLGRYYQSQHLARAKAVNRDVRNRWLIRKCCIDALETGGDPEPVFGYQDAFNDACDQLAPGTTARVSKLVDCLSHVAVDQFDDLGFA